MTATSNRFSLSSLFLVAFAFATYQSGRLKEGEYARGIRIADAHADSLRERSRALEQLAKTWKGIALDHHLEAVGNGSHFRRWHLHGSQLKGSAYKEKLDALGIQLLAISKAQELHILSNFSSNLCIVPIDQLPACGTIVQGGSREQELAEQAGLGQKLADVLMLLPTSVVEAMEAEELAAAQRKGLSVSQIEQTSFIITPAPSNAARSMLVHSIRPLPGVVVTEQLLPRQSH